MRLTIHHQTTYAYAIPARRAVEALRLTPRGHHGQFVLDWRIDVDKDCRLHRTIDAFGNTLHNFTVEGPFSGLAITASGSIETQEVNDAGGERSAQRSDRAAASSGVPARNPVDRGRRRD